jgi:glutaredoxin
MKKFILYTKTTCGFCVKAKNLLSERGMQYEERIVGEGYTGMDVKSHCTKLNESANVSTVPQIIFVEDDKECYVGGYAELNQNIDRY